MISDPGARSAPVGVGGGTYGGHTAFGSPGVPASANVGISTSDVHQFAGSSPPVAVSWSADSAEARPAARGNVARLTSSNGTNGAPYPTAIVSAPVSVHRPP
jgi:hypothetical protein